MKKIFKSQITMYILIIIGLIATVFSFIFMKIIKTDTSIINNIIILFDILLLLINMFYLSYKVSNNLLKSLFNSFTYSIIFLLFFTGIGLMVSEDNASFTVMLNILKILIYLGPSIIILLPIIYIILQG